MTHDEMVASGLHECASDCPLPPMTTSDPQTPRTAAGRALQDEYPGVWWWTDEKHPKRWEGPLGAAIEDEAATGAKPDLLDIPILAEAIRLWYVKAGRNPVTGSYDQPQPAFVAAEYARLAASKEERPCTDHRVSGVSPFCPNCGRTA